MGKFEGLATGDRARIVMEVDVRNVGHRTLGIDGPDPYYIEAADVVSIEKIAPKLPTAPGSVIQGRNGNRRVLINGRWRLVAGSSVVKWFNLDDDRLEGNAYKPIFDAGAS